MPVKHNVIAGVEIEMYDIYVSLSNNYSGWTPSKYDWHEWNEEFLIIIDIFILFHHG